MSTASPVQILRAIEHRFIDLEMLGWPHVEIATSVRDPAAWPTWHLSVGGCVVRSGIGTVGQC